MSESFRIRIHSTSEQDCQLIRQELAGLLKTVHFANSKRYPAFLQYVVEETLAGRRAELKERIVGIEVFDRSSDYDSNSDTVVRVAACEVRKRLALAYHESRADHAIQITLPVGSYAPEFFRTASPQIRLPPTHGDAAVDTRVSQGWLEKLRSSSPWLSLRTMCRRVPRTALAVMLSAVGIIAVFAHLQALARQTSVDLFWGPVRIASSPIIICPGALVRSASTPSGMAIANRKDDYPFTSLATTRAVAELVNLAAKSHTEYVIQPTSSTTLTDMRQHPVILIGAYDNEWTARLQNDLRYRFAPDPARQIYDGVNPASTWMRPSALPLSEEDDFAIVGRFQSTLTDNLVILIAGIGKNGTEAAAQFVTTPRYMDLLDQHRSEGWASKNIEIVLKTKVVNGNSGAPSIEAVYVW